MRRKFTTGALVCAAGLLLAGCDGGAEPTSEVPGVSITQGESPSATDESSTPTAAQSGAGCGGVESGDALDDDLVVASGERCDVVGVTVDGNIEVGDGATLTATDVTVTGNIQGEGHEAVTVATSRVGGDVQLEDGGTATIRETVVDGNLQSENNSGAQEFVGNTIDGDLQCKDNNPAPTGSENSVAGNAEDQCAALAG